MRRKDREITSVEEMVYVLNACKVGRLAMVDGNVPYIVPMNFGVEQEGKSIIVYVHCAKEGRKLDILSRNSNVCFEADCEHGFLESDIPCGYSFTYASVIGEGTAQILTTPEEKCHGLSVILKHQTGKDFSFTEAQAQTVTVIRLRLETVSGKRRKK